jgi:hypothetical protein
MTAELTTKEATRNKNSARRLYEGVLDPVNCSTPLSSDVHVLNLTTKADTIGPN